MTVKRCAWVCRHYPTLEQRNSLGDYQIVQVNPPGRLWSAADAVELSRQACQGWPNLYVVVMPMLMLQNFVTRVDGRVPVVRAVMDFATNRWTGRWEEIKSIDVVLEVWVPGKETT